MTRQEALAEANRIAARLRAPVDIWEHVGGLVAGRQVPGQGRFIARPADKPIPKEVWQRQETVDPPADPGGPPDPVNRGEFNDAVQAVFAAVLGAQNAFEVTVTDGALVAAVTGTSAEMAQLHRLLTQWRWRVGGSPEDKAAEAKGESTR